MRTIIASILALALAALSFADGGVVRERQSVGGYDITVLTDPTPPRVGALDVSLLVLDSATGKLLEDARASVAARRASEPESVARYLATREHPGNRMLLAAYVPLPSAGEWTFDARVEGPKGTASVEWKMTVEPPLPPWREHALWIALPLAPLGLYALYQAMTRRPNSRRR